MISPDATKNIAISATLTSAGFGNHQVLRPLDLQLGAARWVAVVGPNGAGKSTLLRVLAGLLPCEGRVDLLGRPLSDWSGRQRATRLAWLGQAEGGSEDLLALDVVMLGRLPHRAWLAAPGPDDHAAVEHALRASQTWKLRHRRLGELSGGERQRVLLARALAVQAPVLLMDEPLAHLDPPHQADWIALVRAHAAAGGLVISVLHELSVALQADELVIVQGGGIAHHGRCTSAAAHRALEAAFDQRVRVRPVEGQWVALPVVGATVGSSAG